MQIVVTHANMDFDALASEFGITKLYPNAKMILGYPIYGNVRNFLSLYRDSLPIIQLKYLDLSKIAHVYIVDCQRIERLDENIRRLIGSEYNVPYTIFDHHQIDSESLVHKYKKNSVVKNVGSATTLVVEKIIKEKIPLSAFEATLLTIGIYEDTGCLTYKGTTETDAKCVAHLLKYGADLTQVNDYIALKMSEEQIELFHELVTKIEIIYINGLKIVIAINERPKFLDGLASMTRKLLEIEASDAAFVICKMNDRIHLVGRSDSNGINVASIAKIFGGAGHPGAGSAVIKNKPLLQLKQELIHYLELYSKSETTAAEIMTTPVRTILTDTTMQEARRLMLRYNQDGLIVLQNKEILGVVTRRDIDQAIHHKLEHARVLGFMSKPVITVNPATNIKEIQQKMVANDIGRLPVVDEGNTLLGIVTRANVINTLYNDKKSKEANPENTTATTDIPTIDFSERLIRFEPSLKWLFQEIGVIAARLNMIVYLVGGCVRDLILSQENYDLDLVIEGQAIELAKQLIRLYPARFEILATHERFKTATIIFKAEKQYLIDLSTARIEFYEYPAALPQVEESRLKHDLYRRDFSINSLALCLNPGRYGILVDYFQGLADIKAKYLRVLHPFSFIEDPTRIIRMVRFATRFNFKVENKTYELASRAIEMGVLDDLSGTRFANELKQVFESNDIIKALDLLWSFRKSFSFLSPNIQYNYKTKLRLLLATRMIQRYKLNEKFIVYLGVLLANIPNPELNNIFKRLMISNKNRSIIAKANQWLKENESLKIMPKLSEVHNMLIGLNEHSLIIMACVASPGTVIRRMLQEYTINLMHIKLNITGKDLLALGITEGKQIGYILAQTLEAKIDGKMLNDYESEIDYVSRTLTSLPNVNTSKVSNQSS